MTSFAAMPWLVLGCGSLSFDDALGILVAVVFALIFSPMSLTILVPIVVLPVWGMRNLIRALGRALEDLRPRAQAALREGASRRALTRARIPSFGSVWAKGERPNCAELDGASRVAIEAWWLAEARRAHGAVARLARVQWLLVAAGAPVALVREVQRSGDAKVGQAQAYFALAAGHGRRTVPVEPRPDLQRAGLGRRADLISALISEVLEGGCLFSGFGADAAEARLGSCIEPVARAALETAARDDRAHAEQSWGVLAWIAATEPLATRRVLRAARRTLPFVERPQRMPRVTEKWMAKTTHAAALSQGVLPAATLRQVWEERFHLTRAQVDLLLAAEPLASATHSAARRAQSGSAAAALRLG